MYLPIASQRWRHAVTHSHTADELLRVLPRVSHCQRLIHCHLGTMEWTVEATKILGQILGFEILKQRYCPLATEVEGIGINKSVQGQPT